MTEELSNLIETIKEKGIKPYLVQKSEEDTKIADVIINSDKNEMIVGFTINYNNPEKPYGLFPWGTDMNLADINDFLSGWNMGEELRVKGELA